MGIERILETVRSFDGILVFAPDEKSEAPEIAWGDYFFYYAPDGRMPGNVQPFGTIVTKDYPDDTASRLDAGGRWRLNIHVGRDALQRLTGVDPQDAAWPDFSTADVVMPHPVYGSLGWVAIVDPGERTEALAIELLRSAYDSARARATRRAATRAPGEDDPAAARSSS